MRYPSGAQLSITINTQLVIHWDRQDLFSKTVKYFRDRHVTFRHNFPRLLTNVSRHTRRCTAWPPVGKTHPRPNERDQHFAFSQFFYANQSIFDRSRTTLFLVTRCNYISMQVQCFIMTEKCFTKNNTLYKNFIMYVLQHKRFNVFKMEFYAICS